MIDNRQKTWNHHGSYKWVYFPEEAKKLISYFLSDKIKGKNLDIGAGWYNYHPNSTALDLSPISLEASIAKEKVIFDIEELASGERLPFEDQSFSSATMVSVWQYIAARKELIKELQRVLVPGAELYIIGNGSIGLTELFRGPVSPKLIETEIKSYSYDCICERIPFGRTCFESVTVAMPQRDLFSFASYVRDRERRKEESQERESEVFFKEYAAAELKSIWQRCMQLRTYPLLESLQKQKEALQSCLSGIERQTGDIVLAFEEHTHFISFVERINPTFVIISPEASFEREKEITDRVKEQTGISASIYCNYFRSHKNIGTLHRSIEQIREQPSSYEDKKSWEINLYPPINFVSSLPLTTRTQELQRSIEPLLIKKVKDLDKRKRERIYEKLYDQVKEDKQRRTIDNLLLRKEAILREGTVSEEDIPFDDNFFEYYLKRTYKNICEAAHAWAYRSFED